MIASRGNGCGQSGSLPVARGVSEEDEGVAVLLRIIEYRIDRRADPVYYASTVIRSMSDPPSTATRTSTTCTGCSSLPPSVSDWRSVRCT